MNKIVIVAKNKKGVQAIETHLADKVKESYINKVLYNKLFDESFDGKKLILTIKSVKLGNFFESKIKDLSDRIVIVLLKNGAIKDKDYSLRLE